MKKEKKNAMKNIKFMFFNSTNDSDYGQTSLHRALLIFQMILGNLFSSFFSVFQSETGTKASKRGINCGAKL
jgi:hypothetical protein